MFYRSAQQQRFRRWGSIVSGGRLFLIALALCFIRLTVEGICCISACAEEAAGGANTMLGSIQSLERSLGVPPGVHMSLPERTATLEQRVFGAPQQGPLVGRIERLRSVLPGSVVQNAPSGPPNTGCLNDNLPLLNAVSPNFVRTESAEESAGKETDYFAEVMKASKGKVLRFKTMPIPVYVNHFPDKEFVQAVVKGFEVWEEGTSGAIRFVQVDNENDARIQVKWKRLGKEADDKGCLLGGHTITRYTSKGSGSVSLMSVGVVPVPVYIPRMGKKYNVPPQVIEINLDLVMSKHSRIRYRVLQNIVTHELGHALGLLGHSPHVADLMNPISDEHSRLSNRDVNTVLKLYKQKCDVPL